MIPKKLKISNFKGFGEKVEIDFSGYKEDDSILVLGYNADASGADSNLAGKTSVFDAITWAIFNKVPHKNIGLDDLIRRGTKQCEVELTLQDEDNELIINRKRGKNTLLKFSVNGKDETRTTDTQTKRALMQFMGIKEDSKEIFNDFLNTTYFSVEAVETFAGRSATNEDRMALISRFLNLDILDKCSARANSYKSGVNSQLENSKGRVDYLENKLKTEDEGREQTLQEECTNIKVEIREVVNSLEKLQSKFEQIKHKLEIIKDAEKVKDTINSVKNQAEDFCDFIKEHIQSIDNQLAEVEKLTKVIKKLKLEIEKKPALGDIENSLKVLKNKKYEKDEIISEKKNKIINLESSIQNLESMLTDEKWQCPACSTRLVADSEGLHELDLEKYKTTIESKKSELVNTKEELNKHKEELNTITLEIEESYEEKLFVTSKKQELENLQERLTDVDVLESKKIELEGKLTKKKEELEKTIKDLKAQEFKLSLRLKSLDHIDVKETESLELNIGNKSRELDELKQKQTRLKLLIKQRDKDKKDLEQLIEERTAFQEEYDCYAYWEKGFRTIRRWMIESFLPAFESQVNLYLDMFQVGLKISLDTLTKKKKPKDGNEHITKFDLSVIDEQGIKAPFETFSEGGKKRIAVCVGFALRQLTLTKGYNIFNFLLLDEVADRLDNTGIDLFFRVLREISGMKFIISHDNSLKNRFTNNLIVKRENGISYV